MALSGGAEDEHPSSNPPCPPTARSRRRKRFRRGRAWPSQPGRMNKAASDVEGCRDAVCDSGLVNPMLLEPQDVERFFRLHRTLMFFVNRVTALGVIPDNLATPEEFAALPPRTRLGVRDALLDHPDLIQAFVDENPAHLGEDELAIVRSWRHMVAGKFYVFRELKKYTVFLSTDRAARRLRRPGPLAAVRGTDRPPPARHGPDGPPAVRGQDRLRRPDDRLQRLVRPRHPAVAEGGLRGGQGEARDRHVAADVGPAAAVESRKRSRHRSRRRRRRRTRFCGTSSKGSTDSAGSI